MKRFVAPITLLLMPALLLAACGSADEGVSVVGKDVLTEVPVATDVITEERVAATLDDIAEKQVATDVITEEQVAAFLDEVARETNNMNVKALLAQLSDNVYITFSQQGSSTIESFTKDEYAELMSQGFDYMNDYKNSHKNTDITIRPGAKSAVVTMEIVEGGSILGTVFSASTDTIIELELQGGQLLITSIDGIISF